MKQQNDTEHSKTTRSDIAWDELIAAALGFLTGALIIIICIALVAGIITATVIGVLRLFGIA